MKRNLLIVCIGLLLISLAVPAFSAGQRERSEVVINWPTMWVGSDSKAEVVAELIQEFNKEHAGRIRVEVEAMPDHAMYDRKILSSLAAGDPPEVFLMKWNEDTRSFYNTDVLLDFSQALSEGWASSVRNEWIDYVTINGEVKVIPYEHAITPIWYNTRLFEKAGIESFPKTMDEFWEVCEKLKAIGVVPTSQMTGSNNAFTTQMWFSHIVNGLGGPDIWSKPFTDPVYVEAAEILKRLFLDGNTTRDAIGAAAAIPSGHYFAERTAMFINGPWFVGNIRANAPDVYAVTELATFPQVGDYPGSQVGFLLMSFLAANTEDKAQKQAALDFIEFFTKPEAAKRISLAAGSLLTPEFNVDPEEIDPLQQQFIREMNNASFIGRRFDTTTSVSAMEEFGPAVEDLVSGRITAEQFGQRLENAR